MNRLGNRPARSPKTLALIAREVGEVDSLDRRRHVRADPGQRPGRALQILFEIGLEPGRGGERIVAAKALEDGERGDQGALAEIALAAARPAHLAGALEL